MLIGSAASQLRLANSGFLPRTYAQPTKNAPQRNSLQGVSEGILAGWLGLNQRNGRFTN
ncbi:hypothetical protein FAES_3868 [Fibrella aestuarina BUZ 2]|uniref:Uncharacterized protein n=1 Tax=Fibrella aestuarina BUZ 2 TaxID=1166018 RepID=I0KCM1_9BACT|nr:hypothetical protein FAES_3868 [Fibrella aestuarina BUZ 2]